MSCMTMLFAKLATHQSRHQDASKMDCQPDDCKLQMPTSIFLKGLCGYVWVKMLTLSPPRVGWPQESARYNGELQMMVQLVAVYPKSLNWSTRDGQVPEDKCIYFNGFRCNVLTQIYLPGALDIKNVRLLAFGH